MEVRLDMSILHEKDSNTYVYPAGHYSVPTKTRRDTYSSYNTCPKHGTVGLTVSQLVDVSFD